MHTKDSRKDCNKREDTDTVVSNLRLSLFQLKYDKSKKGFDLILLNVLRPLFCALTLG